MLEAITLGIIQGVAEWLPVSSEALIVLAKVNFFGGLSAQTGGLEEILKTALFLHLGTFLAALFYFRQDVAKILKDLFAWQKAAPENKKVIAFLFWATAFSGLLGLIFLQFLGNLEDQIEAASRWINLAIATLLIFTGLLQLKAAKDGLKKAEDLETKDSFILGLVQGMAVLPGLSRSGLTVSALLLRKFQDTESLRLSFLLSLPIVLAGNVLLNFNEATITAQNLLALLFSFIFGYLTIHLLLKLAQKINFGYFVLIFAAALLVSVLV